MKKKKKKKPTESNIDFLTISKECNFSEVLEVLPLIYFSFHHDYNKLNLKS